MTQKDTGTRVNNSTFVILDDKVFGFPVALARNLTTTTLRLASSRNLLEECVTRLNTLCLKDPRVRWLHCTRQLINGVTMPKKKKMLEEICFPNCLQNALTWLFLAQCRRKINNPFKRKLLK